MYNNFTEEARKVLMDAKAEMMKLKHPYVGSEHLFLSILKNDNDVSNRLNEYNITYNAFKDKLIDIVGKGTKQSECFLYTPLLKRVMENAIYDSKENNNGDVTINHLFSSLLEEGEGVAIRILISMNVDIDDLYKNFVYKIPSKKKGKKLLIDSIGTDLNKKARNNELDPVIGRDDELKRIIEILCRRKKNNPILIGPAGVGKTAIVENLSRMIVSDKVPDLLKGKRIINLDMSSMVAGTKYRGEFEERVNKLLKELEENDDIIVFIDEIHTLVGAGGAEGAIDASNIFKPALARNKMRLIGATTTEEYKKFIQKDKALDRRFQKIEINEPNNKVLKDILMKVKDTYSDFHRVIITEEMIDYIIKMSDRYIKFRKEPDRSIDILDEVGSLVSLKSNRTSVEVNNLKTELNAILEKKKEYILSGDFNNACECKKKENKILSRINKLEITNFPICNTVTKQDVDTIIGGICNIKFNNESNEDIKKIEKHLKENIIGQDKAIVSVLDLYKKVRLGVDDKCSSILFLGPTGVGKTMLAKLFSEQVSRNVIKIDGSEYTEPHTISKLLGLEDRSIFDSVKSNPFSMIILDEIDKVSNNILSLFYQILDESKITDSKGETIYFNNCIIIMTTNMGFNNNIGFGDKRNSKLNEYFGTSFINKIDSIIELKKLDKEDISNIISNSIKELKDKYGTIKLLISKKVKENIIELSNYEECGASLIKGIIKNYISSKIINNILNNKNNVSIKVLT